MNGTLLRPWELNVRTVEEDMNPPLNGQGAQTLEHLLKCPGKDPGSYILVDINEALDLVKHCSQSSVKVLG